MHNPCAEGHHATTRSNALCDGSLYPIFVFVTSPSLNMHPSFSMIMFTASMPGTMAYGAYMARRGPLWYPGTPEWVAKTVKIGTMVAHTKPPYIAAGTRIHSFFMTNAYSATKKNGNWASTSVQIRETNHTSLGGDICKHACMNGVSTASTMCLLY